MVNFRDSLLQLDSLGLTDIILPFVLIFAIIYAILVKAKILSSDDSLNKKLSTVIALALALASIFPHITGNGPDIVNIINRALPDVSITLIAILSALIVSGLFGGFEVAGKRMGTILAIISIFIVSYIFLVAAGVNIPDLFYWLDEDIKSFLVVILIFGVIIWFITRPDTPNKTWMDSIKGGLDELMKPHD